MRRLWLALPLVALAACGGEKVDDGRDVAETLRFAMRVGEARAEGRVGPDEIVENVQRETMRAVGLRLEGFHLSPSRATPDGVDGISVTIPHGTDREAVVECLCRRGELAFRIEVLPEYREFHGGQGEKRVREKVWMGATGTDAEGKPASFADTRDGFDAFKEMELSRFLAAAKAARAYAPFDARYRVVPREWSFALAQTERAVDRFVVLEEPKNRDDRFGGEILENVRPGPDKNGRPGIFYRVRTAYGDAFATWTGANVGLPIGIVLDGMLQSAPILNSPLHDAVVITLGGGSMESRVGRERAERFAEALTLALRNRPMRVRLERSEVRTGTPEPR